MSHNPDDGEENGEGPPYRSLEALQRAEEQATEAMFRKIFGKYEPVVMAVIGFCCITFSIFSLYKVIFTELSARSFAGFMTFLILISSGIIFSAIKGTAK